MKNWCQYFAFKWVNLHRYATEIGVHVAIVTAAGYPVGLC
jgi:hypothetical protein